MGPVPWPFVIARAGAAPLALAQLLCSSTHPVFRAFHPRSDCTTRPALRLFLRALLHWPTRLFRRSSGSRNRLSSRRRTLLRNTWTSSRVRGTGLLRPRLSPFAGSAGRRFLRRSRYGCPPAQRAAL